MVKTLEFVDFQDLTYCFSEFIPRSSRESFLKLNYKFECGKIYGIVSDYGCGSWGISTCISGGCSTDFCTGKIFLNGLEISPLELSKYACTVFDNVFDGINSSDNLLSARECISLALKKSGLEYTTQQIKKMFGLSDERFDRSLENVSGEIQRISIAVNFALGKDIFCFPWLNWHDLGLIDKSNLDMLKKHSKMVIIPTSQKSAIKKIADKMLIIKIDKISMK